MSDLPQPAAPGRATRRARAEANRQRDLHVVVEDVLKEQNASSILRTAEAVGAGTLHAVRTDDLSLEYTTRITRGAEQWIETEFYREPGSCIARLTEAGLRIYCTALSARSIDFRTVDYTIPCAVVFGNEAEGASASFRALADAEIMIPMMGLSQSLNAAAAAAVVLYEAQRQRAAAGMYGDAGVGALALAPETRTTRGP